MDLSSSLDQNHLQVNWYGIMVLRSMKINLALSLINICIYNTRILIVSFLKKENGSQKRKHWLTTPGGFLSSSLYLQVYGKSRNLAHRIPAPPKPMTETWVRWFISGLKEAGLKLQKLHEGTFRGLSFAKPIQTEITHWVLGNPSHLHELAAEITRHEDLHNDYVYVSKIPCSKPWRLA